MAPTLRLISFLHRAAVNPKTQEPRRGVFALLYYGTGGFAAFIVATMILLCLEAYDLGFAREFLYRQLGARVLAALETVLF